MPKPASRKRKGPKSTRRGCLQCKPHKAQWQSQRRSADGGNLRRLRAAERDLEEAGGR